MLYRLFFSLFYFYKYVFIYPTGHDNKDFNLCSPNRNHISFRNPTCLSNWNCLIFDARMKYDVRIIKHLMVQTNTLKGS